MEAQGNPAPQGQQPQQGGGGWLGTAFRFLLMYLAIQYFFGGKGTTKQPPSEKTTVVNNIGGKTGPHRNGWASGTEMDVYVYLADNPYRFLPENVVWQLQGLHYDSRAENDKEVTLDVDVNAHMLNNGTVYTHVVVTKAAIKPYSLDADGLVSVTQGDDVIHKVHTQNKYLKRPKASEKKNLISGDVPDARDLDKTPAALPTEYISFWKPNLTLQIVDDMTVYTRGAIPEHVRPHLQFDENGNYKPVIYFNEFWVLRESLMAVNESVRTLPLHMTFGATSLWKWMLQTQMQSSFEMQESMGMMAIGAGSEDESTGSAEEIKRMLLETNPALLAVTFAVSLLHTVFEFLAFKNDIQFWKNNKSMEGLSVKSILLNTGCQFIIFLYLLDNETSWVILLSVGVGVLIELWKVQKAITVKVTWNGRMPSVAFEDKASYASKTKEFDDFAMKYLAYILYALVIGYAIYSLVYQTHKSWYSWILSSLVGTVYTFGFVMMTPQLFINYKLKTVSHLPWRVFMYKALNTFIDDLFAFIIKMPALHRLSVLRDDLIFVIYLYQRWIYRVDKNRVNEFGQSFGESEENLAAADAAADAATPALPSSSSSDITEDAAIVSDAVADKNKKKKSRLEKKNE